VGGVVVLFVCSFGGGGEGSLSFLPKCCQAHHCGATEIHFVFQCPVYDQETILNVAKVLVCASKVIQNWMLMLEYHLIWMSIEPL